MVKRAFAAALLLPLIFTAPAAAQSIAAAGSGAPNSRLGPSYVPTGSITGSAVPTADGRAAFGYVSTPNVEPEGGIALRKGLIGSVPIARNVDLGLGLFRVTHKNPNQRVVRVDPMGDTRGPEQKIAAVGLNIRF